jgi:hypothetical protein
MMRKRNNNMRNNNGGQQGRNNGGGRRYNNGGGHRSGGGANDGQNLQRQKQHATQSREKFMNMARDAQNNGDRVDVEYYLQHVEHYGRVLADIQLVENERFAHQREQQVQQQPEQGDGQGAQSNDESAEPSNEQQPVEMVNQPRMTHRGRQPRSHFSAPIEERNRENASSDNNNDSDHNNGDIPLPGSILPII